MRIYLLAAALLCLVAAACTKHQDSPPAPNSKNDQADVVYHYKNVSYPLYFLEGTEELVQDGTYQALQAATVEQNIVTFHYSDRPANHIFLFDSELEGYIYMEEQDDNPLIGRKFRLSYLIDELRDNLIAQFGKPLDFKDAQLAQAAHTGVEAIYQELHINAPFPSDLAAFIGSETNTFQRQKTGVPIKSNPVLTVWEHDNFQGNELYVEQAPNTVIWNYGDWNCFTMAANPDLTLEFQPNGNNWNDCISSKCLSYIQGADAIGEGFYKDSHFGIYPCSRMIYIYYPNGTGTGMPLCDNISVYPWQGGAFCGHANDQISSIRIKAVWEGCYTGDEVFLDLINQ